MTDIAPGVGVFAFKAQTAHDTPISGTIDAPDIEQASRRLSELQLRVLNVEPVDRPPRAKALKTEDFLAFNQQLAYLTQAGLPVEQGLKLMAQDLGTGRLADTVRQVSEDLEKGVPLAEAFNKHRGRFPALYGRLIDAGVRAHDLPGMLLNLGRHVELLTRMRRMLWRTASYPLMASVALVCVLCFLGMSVLPKFVVVFRDFGTKLPPVTEAMIALVHALPWLLSAVGVTVIGAIVLWSALRLTPAAAWITDVVFLRLPLIGAVMRRNMVARWCDIIRMGVQAGLDLPAAIDLAGDAIGSPGLKREGEAIARFAQTSAASQTPAIRGSDGVLDYYFPTLNRLLRRRGNRILPATVTTLLELSTARQDLPEMLGTLSAMYQQQAELRLTAIPVILVPILILAIASVVVFVIIGMFAPMISLIQSVSSGGK